MIGKALVDVLSFVKKAGDTMTGQLKASGDPVADDDMARKLYVDTKAATSADAFAQGLKAELTANGGVEGGNLAKTVQVVMAASTGTLQIGSPRNNNTVVIYASGADRETKTEKSRIALNKGEIHIETGIAAGAVIESTDGVFGYSDAASFEAPISMAPEGFAGTTFFVNIFRNASNGNNIFVAAGAVASDVEVQSGDGLTTYDSASLGPYGYAVLSTGTVDGEYRIVATRPVFAACRGNNAADLRLVPPLAKDIIGQNRSAAVSALFANTEVWWYRRNGELGKCTVSPGSPVNLDGGTINELGDVIIIGSNATPATAGTFTIEINGAVTPDIAYNAGVKALNDALPLSTLVGSYTVTGATITNNTTDVTVTDVAHGLTTGDNVRVSNTSDSAILPNGDYDNITVIDVDNYTINYVPTGGTTGTADLVDYSYPYVAADFKVEAILENKLDDASAQIIIYCMGSLARVAGTPTIDTTGLTGNAHTLTLYQSGTAAANAGSDGAYKPDGCIRLISSAEISCFSGADFAGSEATYFMPVKSMSQTIPIPIATIQATSAQRSSITIQSVHKGVAQVFRDDTSKVYEFTVDRDSSITVDSAFKQRFPCAYQVAGTSTGASAGSIENFIEDYLGGYVEANVAINCIYNSDDNDVLISGGINTSGDETVHFGVTDPDCRAEITCDAKKLLRKRTIDATGTETWDLV